MTCPTWWYGGSKCKDSGSRANRHYAAHSGTWSRQPWQAFMQVKRAGDVHSPDGPVGRQEVGCLSGPAPPSRISDILEARFADSTISPCRKPGITAFVSNRCCPGQARCAVEDLAFQRTCVKP